MATRDCSRSSLDSQDTQPLLHNSEINYRRSKSWTFFYGLNLAIFIFNSWSFANQLSLNSRSKGNGTLNDAEYTPLKKLIKHNNQYWNLSFGDFSQYTKPPSPEVDAAWNEITAPAGAGLGNVGVVAAPKDELTRLNLTSIKFADGRGYVAVIDVFHQLHCLNMLRMAINGKTTHETKEVWEQHIAHCIDSVRLSLQCSADISLLSFKWLKTTPSPMPDFRSYHKCRNWDAILQYAKEHQVDTNEKDLLVHPIYGSLSRITSINITKPDLSPSQFVEESS